VTDLATPELVQETSNALTVAKEFRVTSEQHYIESADRLKAIKALAKKLDETFDPHIKRAFDAHRALVAEKKGHQQPLIDAEGYVKRAVLGYQQEQERIRRAAEAKAQEEARKERERLEAQAAKAAEKGKVEKAAALQTAAAAVVAPIIAPTTPKIAGLSTRTTYRADVTSKLELVKAVAAGSVPLNALEPNMTFLNNQARVLKEDLIYPGVRVVTDSGIASRSA
jgi:colicin import membrane protein